MDINEKIQAVMSYPGVVTRPESSKPGLYEKSQFLVLSAKLSSSELNKILYALSQQALGCHLRIIIDALGAPDARVVLFELATQPCFNICAQPKAIHAALKAISHYRLSHPKSAEAINKLLEGACTKHFNATSLTKEGSFLPKLKIITQKRSSSPHRALATS